MVSGMKHLPGKIWLLQYHLYFLLFILKFIRYFCVLANRKKECGCAIAVDSKNKLRDGFSNKRHTGSSYNLEPSETVVIFSNTSTLICDENNIASGDLIFSRQTMLKVCRKLLRISCTHLTSKVCMYHVLPSRLKRYWEIFEIWFSRKGKDLWTCGNEERFEKYQHYSRNINDESFNSQSVMNEKLHLVQRSCTWTLPILIVVWRLLIRSMKKRRLSVRQFLNDIPGIDCKMVYPKELKRLNCCYCAINSLYVFEIVN